MKVKQLVSSRRILLLWWWCCCWRTRTAVVVGASSSPQSSWPTSISGQPSYSSHLDDDSEATRGAAQQPQPVYYASSDPSSQANSEQDPDDPPSHPQRYPSQVQDDDNNWTAQGFRPWGDDDNDPEAVSRRPPPPPPPPPEPRRTAAVGSSSSYAYDSHRTTTKPIHYQFQSRSQTEPADSSTTQTRGTQTMESRLLEEEEDVSVTHLAQEDDYWTSTRERVEETSASGGDASARLASTAARRDAVTRFLVRHPRYGRPGLALASATVGAMLGAFVGQSVLSSPRSVAGALFVTFFVASFLRNPYGQLVQALGLALIRAMTESRHIRRRYPTGPHVRAVLGAGPRRRFPAGTDNPWEAGRGNGDFNMLYALLAMALVGSLCGGNLPLVPSWMGGLAGAALLAAGCTDTRSPRGDLCRTMGMRVVALFQFLLQVNQELQLLQKLGLVSSKVLDKLLILDRQHRIRDRLVQGASWAYDQSMRTVSQMQRGEAQPEEPSREEGGRRGEKAFGDNRDRRRRSPLEEDDEDAAPRYRQRSNEFSDGRDAGRQRRGPNDYQQPSQEDKDADDRYYYSQDR